MSDQAGELFHQDISPPHSGDDDGGHPDCGFVHQPPYSPISASSDSYFSKMQKELSGCPFESHDDDIITAVGEFLGAINVVVYNVF